MDVILKSRTLKEHIQRRNITQNAFALKAGVSSGYLAQLMHGKRKPSPQVRERLQAATGFDFDGLFQIVVEEEASNG